MLDGDKLLKLKEFVVHDKELELLEAKLGEFNPLKVLNVQNHEIRHSNILAWLLNPNENHGFGDKLLKKVISEIILTNEDVEFPFSVTQIQSFNFFDAEVLREHSNTDILVISRANKFILLIENKVLSGEKKGQLAGYAKKIKDEYPGYKILPVLLTLSGDEVRPGEEGSSSVLSHVSIYSITKFILELYKENLNPKIFDFVNFYLKTLGVLTMQDNNEVVKLCKDIYKQHKEAIDAIVSYGMSSPLDEALNEFKKEKQIVETFRNNTMLWFVPKAFEKIVPKISKEDWGGGYPVSYWFKFSQKENWFGLVLEVGPFDDSVKRARFMKLLKDYHSFRVPAKTLEPKEESRYTRIFSKYIDFDEWDDLEELVDKMNDLFNVKAKEVNVNILKVIELFKWSKA